MPFLENAASISRASRFITLMSAGNRLGAPDQGASIARGTGGWVRAVSLTARGGGAGATFGGGETFRGGGAGAIFGCGIATGFCIVSRFVWIISRIFRHCSPARLRATALER